MTSEIPALRSRTEFFLTGVTPTGASDENCSICTEALHHDVVKLISCGHHFHTTCIATWLQGDRGVGNRSCPNCRQLLFEAAPPRLSPAPDMQLSHLAARANTAIWTLVRAMEAELVLENPRATQLGGGGDSPARPSGNTSPSLDSAPMLQDMRSTSSFSTTGTGTGTHPLGELANMDPLLAELLDPIVSVTSPHSPRVSSTGPGYSPSSPRYAPQSPQLRSRTPTSPPFLPARSPGFCPSSPVYNPTSPRYSPMRHPFGTASPAYTPTSPRFSPMSPQFGTASPGYTPTSPRYSPMRPHFGTASPAYTPTSPAWPTHFRRTSPSTADGAVAPFRLGSPLLYTSHDGQVLEPAPSSPTSPSTGAAVDDGMAEETVDSRGRILPVPTRFYERRLRRRQRREAAEAHARHRRA
ncbi:hypothetical protein ACEQ8H_002181 [Pleosporales sp. CAS-2024a]